MRNTWLPRNNSASSSRFIPGRLRVNFGTKRDTPTKVCPYFQYTSNANPCTGWLDGIYMGEVFYATYTQKFQPHNQTAWGTFLPNIKSKAC